MPHRVLAAFLTGMIIAGCAAVDMPPVDLSDPQWRVHRGQALWKPPSHRLQITGDLVVAENSRGDVWVSLTKSLLPIFTARTWRGTWSINFVQRGETHRGRGKPPVQRFIWFYLPKIFDGASPPSPWRVTKRADEMVLENDRTGEKINAVFDL